jgi:hypothetical protein
MKIIKIFCQVHDFWTEFQAEWQKVLIQQNRSQRRRTCSLCMSEVMTIVILFHFSRYRTFKDYYQQQVVKHYQHYFPGLVSYNRFVELMQRCCVHLSLFMSRRRVAQTQGVAFIDSTALAVCLTPGNVDDRKPVEQLTRNLWGKLFGDKGYISESLAQKLKEKGVDLVTKPRRNMKQKLLDWFDKLMLRKRALIESVNDFLKNTCQIEHTRHRSKSNWLVNLIAALVAYSFLPNKTHLKFKQEFTTLIIN